MIAAFFQQLNAHCNILPDFVLCTTETRCSVEVFLQFFKYPNERVYLGDLKSVVKRKNYTVNNYMQVTGMVTGENFAFFIYRHFVEIL